MKSLYLDQNLVYDGSQLRSLFAYMTCGLAGDSMVAWVGPCQVDVSHMVDGEDLRAGERICGAQMVHFIVEKYNASLLAAVALQRLLTSVAVEILTQLPDANEICQALRREGDDIYFEDRKLSISIATVSPTSALIHFAVNVTNEGTPVKTLALSDLGVKPRTFADEVLKRFSAEVESIELATQKVKWVR